MNKNEAFQVYSQLLKDGIGVLRNREDQQLTLSHLPEAQSSDQALVNIFRTNSMNTYRKYSEFISDEIIKYERENTALFQLPNLRTLMDIYARFLYLHNNDFSVQERFLKILSYQLLTFHVLGDTAQYDRLIKIHSAHLRNVKPDYPQTWKDFKYQWLRKEDLLIPGWRDVLTEEIIKKSSPRASKIFKGMKREYEKFKYLSELVHGNPFVVHDSTRKRYWLASMSVSVTACFLELIDNEIFHDDKRRDLREWLKRAQESRQFLAEHWQSEREQEQVQTSRLE